MAKQMKVEISSPKGLNGEWLYASLDLPAEEHEIRDAYHRARVMSHEDERYLSVYDCDAFPMLSFVRVETEGIDELNFLAQRLDSLEEHERNVLLAITPRIIKNVGEGDVVSAKDLINMTYGLDKVTVAPYDAADVAVRSGEIQGGTLCRRTVQNRGNPRRCKESRQVRACNTGGRCNSILQELVFKVQVGNLYGSIYHVIADILKKFFYCQSTGFFDFDNILGFANLARIRFDAERANGY